MTRTLVLTLVTDTDADIDKIEKDIEAELNGASYYYEVSDIKEIKE